MILMDSADVAVTSNEYVCWNIVELSALRMIQYGLPIFMVVALERQFTEFELSVGNSGIFFPNILVCCLGSRRFRVDGIAKGLFEGGQGDFPFAVRKQLPMEISCCISLFELSSDIIKVRCSGRRSLRSRLRSREAEPLRSGARQSSTGPALFFKKKI